MYKIWVDVERAAPYAFHLRLFRLHSALTMRDGVGSMQAEVWAMAGA